MKWCPVRLLLARFGRAIGWQPVTVEMLDALDRAVNEGAAELFSLGS